MKIVAKRKNVGSRSSEVKHEVVLETSTATNDSTTVKDNSNKKNGTVVNNNHVHNNKKDKKDKSVIRSPTPASVSDHQEKVS